MQKNLNNILCHITNVDCYRGVDLLANVVYTKKHMWQMFGKCWRISGKSGECLANGETFVECGDRWRMSGKCGERSQMWKMSGEYGK